MLTLTFNSLMARSTLVCFIRITDMTSYQAAVQLKYQLMGGTFRPVVGGVAAYTYRKYTDIQFGSSADNGSSNSIDLGLLAGADAQISTNFSLGLEVVYFWNLYNQTNVGNGLTPYYGYVGNAQTPENMGNTSINLTTKMSF